MADTILKSVAIRNWCMVRDAVIEFPEQGLVLVRGVNTAAKGKMASIGSGKTCMGEAVSRALFGVKGRFSHLGHFSTHGKGDTLVEVNCEHLGKPLKVEMGFKVLTGAAARTKLSACDKCEELSPIGESLRFTYDGRSVMRSRIEETRQDLCEILTVSSDLASWTVHLDGDRLSFDSLAERRAVDLLMDALQQPRWTLLNKKANSTASILKHDLVAERVTVENAKSHAAQVEVDLHTAKQNLTQSKNVYNEALKLSKNRIKVIDGEIGKFSGEITRLKAEMAKTKKEIDRRTSLNAEQEKKLEISVNEHEDDLADLNDAKAPLSSTANRASFSLEQARKSLERAKVAPKNCPTCGKAWDRAKEALNEHTKAATDAETAFDKADEKLASQVQKIAKKTATLAQARQQLKDLRAQAPIDELSDQYEEMEEDLENVNAQLAEAQKDKLALQHGPDKVEITRFETQVSERETIFKAAHKAIGEAAAKVVEDEEMLRVVEYWQDAYAASGIPNMVLGDALAPLNMVSRRISTVMSGDTLEVSYATSRELASGGDRSELAINVNNKIGSSRVEGNSKGEGQLTNLIVAETLAEVGGIAGRIGYRWYDECLTNQDEIVRHAYYAYLSSLAKRHGSLIFLVTHDAHAMNYADFILVAEKTSATGIIYRWEN